MGTIMLCLPVLSNGQIPVMKKNGYQEEGIMYALKSSPNGNESLIIITVDDYD